ncbi:MAG: hypothetical protein AAF288_12880 [Planctomycetota bacterium]
MAKTAWLVALIVSLPIQSIAQSPLGMREQWPDAQRRAAEIAAMPIHFDLVWRVTLYETDPAAHPPQQGDLGLPFTPVKEVIENRYQGMVDPDGGFSIHSQPFVKDRPRETHPHNYSWRASSSPTSYRLRVGGPITVLSIAPTSYLQKGLAGGIAAERVRSWATGLIPSMGDGARVVEHERGIGFDFDVRAASRSVTAVMAEIRMADSAPFIADHVLRTVSSGRTFSAASHRDLREAPGLGLVPHRHLDYSVRTTPAGAYVWRMDELVFERLSANRFADALYSDGEATIPAGRVLVYELDEAGDAIRESPFVLSGVSVSSAWEKLEDQLEASTPGATLRREIESAAPVQLAGTAGKSSRVILYLVVAGLAGVAGVVLWNRTRKSA